MKRRQPARLRHANLMCASLRPTRPIPVGAPIVTSSSGMINHDTSVFILMPATTTDTCQLGRIKAPCRHDQRSKTASVTVAVTPPGRRL